MTKSNEQLVQEALPLVQKALTAVFGESTYPVTVEDKESLCLGGYLYLQPVELPPVLSIAKNPPPLAGWALSSAVVLRSMHRDEPDDVSIEELGEDTLPKILEKVVQTLALNALRNYNERMAEHALYESQKD